jgi:hypothetical protein
MSVQSSLHYLETLPLDVGLAAFIIGPEEHTARTIIRRRYTNNSTSRAHKMCAYVPVYYTEGWHQQCPVPANYNTSTRTSFSL